MSLVPTAAREVVVRLGIGRLDVRHLLQRQTGAVVRRFPAPANAGGLEGLE